MERASSRDVGLLLGGSQLVVDMADEEQSRLKYFGVGGLSPGFSRSVLAKLGWMNPCCKAELLSERTGCVSLRCVKQLGAPLIPEPNIEYTRCQQAFGRGSRKKGYEGEESAPL